jgi:hypothetical protein
MNKIVKHINENDIPDMVKMIIDSKKDINSVIQQIKLARAEFQRKSQEFQDELVKLLPNFEVGMTLEAKEDCMNNFRKGQKVDITFITEDGDIVLDGVAAIDPKMIRTYFKIAGGGL